MPPALLKHSSVLSRFRHIATSQTDGGARSACGVHALDGTAVEGRKQGRSSWALRSTAGGLVGCWDPAYWGMLPERTGIMVGQPSCEL